MRRFSFAPSFTLRGRKFKGLRGWAGKPLHPPLTDVPVTAYLLGAGFDVCSVISGSGTRIGGELFDAAGWAFIAGGIVSLGAALTGWADWRRSSSPGTQARRTINAHAITMITTSALAALDILLRYTTASGSAVTPAYLLVLSLLTVVGVTAGATVGGTLVYDYGFNVETAGDSPVWHPSESDVSPATKLDSAIEPVA